MVGEKRWNSQKFRAKMPEKISNFFALIGNNNTDRYAEVGTNNIISKAQCNIVQRSFQPVKAQRNFRNELFDSDEALQNNIFVPS